MLLTTWRQRPSTDDAHRFCQACSRNRSGWVLETVIDHGTGLVTSREVPCPDCIPAPAPQRRRRPAATTRRRHPRRRRALLGMLRLSRR
ncbi:hypothetical protein ABZ863_15705 [Saccharomonospora sp. NPDC046836]|uniref:hypothetical protein n=1 Tax=Saccharomonospora sp. NPDC046836 TaxID=3156921 RepID=UPI0033F058D9